MNASDASGFVGVRDRSWGVRPIGEPIAGPPAVPQFFWLWAPTVFEDACTHLALNHEGSGCPWHQSGAVVPTIDVSPTRRSTRTRPAGAQSRSST
ncbi:MAG: hypothetical protein R2697_07585 [Ilumatobacteraceae bacterium]